MVRQLAKGVVNLLRTVTGAEFSERSHQVELIGTHLDNDGKNKDVNRIFIDKKCGLRNKRRFILDV